MSTTAKKNRPAKDKKKAQPKTVEVEVEQLVRLRNTLLLQNRIHFGKTTGRGVGQALGSILMFPFDPITGASEFFGLVEGLGGGIREGLQTSRLVYVDSKTRSGRKNLDQLQSKLQKLRKRTAQHESTFMSEQELSEISDDPELAEALAQAQG